MSRNPGVSDLGAGVPLVYNGALSPLFSFTRSSTKYVLGSNGVLQSFSNNLPAREYDANGLLLGTLLEEQKTNYCLRSQEFDNASWTKTGLLAFGSGSVVNATTAPDGTSTAEKIVEDSAAGAYHACYQIVGTLSLTSAFSISVWLKAAERTQALVMVGNTRSTHTIVNLSTGVCSALVGAESANCSASSVQYPNGWWRVTLSGTFGVADTAYFWIGASNGSSTYNGDGASGIYVWGAQAEQAGMSTSYIPTTSASATRTADSATISALSNIGFSATAGSFLMTGTIAGAASLDIAAFSDNTASEWICAPYSNGGTQLGLRIQDGGVNQCNTATNYTVGNAFKVSGAWQANSFASSLNGAAVASDVSGTLPTVTRFDLGASVPVLGGTTRRVYIKDYIYWSARLPDYALVSLSR